MDEKQGRVVVGVDHEVIGQFESKIGQLPPVTVRATAGGPAHALLKAAVGADLLVVGSRGHGGFSSMLLGSVGLKCALHATCPIRVVHGVPKEKAEEPVPAEDAPVTA